MIKIIELLLALIMYFWRKLRFDTDRVFKNRMLEISNDFRNKNKYLDQKRIKIELKCFLKVKGNNNKIFVC